jgi:hypothetical protein
VSIWPPLVAVHTGNLFDAEQGASEGSCHQSDRACRAHERLHPAVSRVMCESANATLMECTRPSSAAPVAAARACWVLHECSTRISSAVSTQMCGSGGRGCRFGDQSTVRAGAAPVAASCRTGRKDRTQLTDASLSRRPIAKTGAAFPSVRKSAFVTHGPAARVSERSAGRCAWRLADCPPIKVLD